MSRSRSLQQRFLREQSEIHAVRLAIEATGVNDEIG